LEYFSLRCLDLEIVYLWPAGIKAAFIPSIENFCYFQAALLIRKSYRPFIGLIAAVALNLDLFVMYICRELYSMGHILI
jgi:hypothetical protein